ncbi:class I SAM-dependent methyltransferase [Mesorhizobium sp. B2-1-3A]|uniref:class I SAM-dependent methyltransferase n=1 Tax=Mesorhizobium sp. B2-1-3A TaxID=2589971 RepID=UPI001129A0EC|nr:class I SAM-dependent methyltransferase [Mesorhizobium sp. B2-1-3A]TPN01692.1 class I SAM-dependent methyltransferase [Mesorhizobium sp. B2-1-3A]
MKKTFDDLYKAFEDRFRGSRELVKDRLKIYQPLLAQVPRQAEGPTLAIDLGCGRGEWLEILAEAGFDATGVDTNARMAQEATDNGLKIELQDAVDYLGGRPNNSVAVISAFHMVEHVPTDYLIRLLDECNRVLTNDGLLILETPNPENISVGTHTFHLDPTHRTPLPPSLLEFLVEQAGFAETAILRLNGIPATETGPMERSFHLMFEVARDYACLARKRDKDVTEEGNSLAAFVQVASEENPIDIEKIKSWLRSVDNEVSSIPTEVRGAISTNADQLRHLSVENAVLQDAVAVLAARDAEIDRLGESVATLVEQVQQLTARTSTVHVLAAQATPLGQWSKDKLRLFMSHALLWVGRRPKVRLQLRRIVSLMPPLERRLLLFAHSRPRVTMPGRQGRWMMEPDPVVLAEWKKILREHQR